MKLCHAIFSMHVNRRILDLRNGYPTVGYLELSCESNLCSEIGITEYDGQTLEMLTRIEDSLFIMWFYATQRTCGCSPVNNYVEGSTLIFLTKCTDE